MSTISQAEVERLAQLGRIQLSAEEVSTAAAKLQDIFGYFAAIQKIDTVAVPPTSNSASVHNRMRLDEVRRDIWCSASVLIAAAPAQERQHIKVKAIFD